MSRSLLYSIDENLAVSDILTGTYIKQKWPLLLFYKVQRDGITPNRIVDSKLFMINFLIIVVFLLIIRLIG